MKSKLILFVFLCCIGSNLQAQDTSTYYCNSYALKTVKDSAAFLRKAFFANGHWNVLDYYLDGHIKCSGAYNGKNEKNGHFVYYYENGNKFREGNYYKDFRIGNWMMWYDNTATKSNENYSRDTALIDKMAQDGIASVKLFSVDIAMYFSEVKGIFKDTSSWYYPNGNIADREVWTEKLSALYFWKEDGKKITIFPKIDDENWRHYIEVGPEFKGDLEKLLKANDIKYSRNDAIFDPITNVHFDVHTNGEVDNITYFPNPRSKKIDSATFDKYKQLVLSTKGMWKVGSLHNLPTDFNTGFGATGSIGYFTGWIVRGHVASYNY